MNPRGAGGRAERRWPRMEPRLRAALGDLEVEHTRGPRDACRIASEAARAGVQRLVVVGGDGTLSEVATGLLDHQLADGVVIGLLPLGTGCDFARGLGIPREPEAAIACIAAGRTRRVDAGRVTFQREGRPQSACFVNVASFGASGVVNERVSQSSRALGGTLAFAKGAIQGILEYRSQRVRLCVDGEVVHDAPLVLAAGANAPCFGGGMRVAPDARPDDGLLDLVVVGGVSKLRLLGLLARGYRGRHIDDPAVSQYRGRTIEAEAPPGLVPIELDGEPLGSLPARYEVLPAALDVLVPA